MLAAFAMQDDKHVIASVSSGRALCGFRILDHDSSTMNALPSKQLLRCPEHCDLLGSSQQFTTQSISFSSISASTQFCETVKRCGWSIGAKIAVGSIPGIVCGFGGELGGGREKWRADESSTTTAHVSKEACIIECLYAPIKSFRITTSQMRLTEEALADACSVKTPAQAKEFLNSYNSHLYNGVYHVGGVLFRAVSVTASVETSLTILLDTAAQQFDVAAGLSAFKAFGGDAQAKFVRIKEIESSSKKECRAQQAEIRFIVTALGPCTDSKERFLDLLANERSTWQIIDRSDDASNLVPVWDIIKQHEGVSDVNSCVNLIRAAWQDAASLHAMGNKKLFDLLQSSFTQLRVEPRDFKLEASDLLQKMMKDFHLKRVENSRPYQASKMLCAIWTTASKEEDWELTLKCLFQVPIFIDLLNYVAESAGQDMEIVKQQCREKFNKDVQHTLQKAGVHLSGSIITMLKTPSAEIQVERLTPRLTITPAELPRHLENFIDTPSIPAPKSDPALTDLVEEAVATCMDTCPTSNEALVKIFQGYGFNSQRRRFAQVLSKEHVRRMIQQLTSELDSDPKDIDRKQEGRAHISTRPPPTRPPPNMFVAPESQGAVYRYIGDIVVDRTLPKDDPHKKLIDCIRHRMEPFVSVGDVMQSDGCEDDLDPWSSEDPSDSTYQGKVLAKESTMNLWEKNSNYLCPLELLVQVIESSDFSAQIELCKLLLEQRSAVPLVIPCSQKDIASQVSFRHIAGALCFVQVKLEQEKILSIADDTKLHRVVFVSNRSTRLCQSAYFASEVMKCNFASKHGNPIWTRMGPIVELATGFVPIPRDSLGNHLSCLVMHVWGDYTQLGSFIGKIANVVVIESEPETAQTSNRVPVKIPGLTCDLLNWKIHYSNNGKDLHTRTIWGSSKYITEKMRSILYASLIKGKNSREICWSLDQVCCSEFQSLHKIIEPEPNVEQTLANVEWNIARKILWLQKSYLKESKEYFEWLKPRGDIPDRHMKALNCKKEQDGRAKGAVEVLNLPIIQVFLDILSVHDPIRRRIDVMHFQSSIEKRSRSTLEKVGKEMDDAFQAFQIDPKNPRCKSQFYYAKAAYVGTMLGLEHLWRELSHIYLADPAKQQLLPKLAALHLLDGFPLEILDGDAGMFFQPWVNVILMELNRQLHESLGREPKVFVLSVMGLQSSGKSTLLNIMFGTQLRTSAGQCTRGVYLQLVKSEFVGYDYVLLLDCEGIRAPEYFGLDDAEAHDNRLATFAVLPADACVIVIANEDDFALKEVIPMVMLAFKGSAIAEKNCGQIRSKLFFVYRSIDTNDVGKLRGNQQKLQEHLQEAALEVANRRVCGRTKVGEADNSLWSNMLERSDDPIGSILGDFQVSRREATSDVKYLGNLKKGNVPPEDTPDWAYGTKVMEVREYIHNRVTQGSSKVDNGRPLGPNRWRPRGLRELGEYLGMVWKCICSADFELSFKSTVEYWAYDELQAKLVGPSTEIARKYLVEFEALQGNLLQMKNDTDHSTGHLNEFLSARVQDTLKAQEQVICAILNNPRWQKWKQEEMMKWRELSSCMEKQWRGRLQDCIDGILKFDNVVKEYHQKMQMEIKGMQLFKQNLVFDSAGEFDEKTLRYLENAFKELFQRVLKDAMAKHQPFLNRVPSLVNAVYKRHIVSHKHDLLGEYTSAEEPYQKDKKSEKPLPQTNTEFHAQPSTSSGASNRSMEYLKMPKLEGKIDLCLQGAKQYSDHLVNDVIQETLEHLESLEKVQRQAEELVHRHVKQLVTEKLEKIQQEWDAQHNVAARLESEKPQLWQFFKNCAYGLGGTEMLTKELAHIFENNLTEAFKTQLTNRLADMLQREAWVHNWKVLRAYLDLHLINLIHKRDTNELLKCVSNGKWHYKTVVENLIQEKFMEVQKDDPWSCYVRQVKSVLQSASMAAICPDFSWNVRVFLEKLIELLRSEVKSVEMAKCVSLVHTEIYEKCEEEHQFGIQVNTVVSEVCRSIDEMPSQMQLIADWSTDMVKERMILWSNEAARPRCEEMCPLCSLTCFHPAGHSGKHDTLHQPRGLSGCGYVESKDGVLMYTEGGLCEASCASNSHFWFEEHPTVMSCRKFPEVHLGWAIPSEGFGDVRVREYIFYHYQRELAAKYPPKKMCTNMPPTYNRNLKLLRLELENQISNYS